MGRRSAEFRQLGLRRFVHKRLMLMIRPWITLCGVYERAIDTGETTHRHPIAIPDLSIRVATAADLKRACADPSLGLSEASVRSALARGDLCVAAFEGERMIAYLWRSFTTAPHSHGLWVHFEKPHRYGYKAYTQPEFRGRHLSDPMARYLDDYCIERGYTRTIAFIETHNFPSIASDRRRGSRRVGWVGYFTLFGRAYPFRSPGARRHRFGFKRGPGESQGARSTAGDQNAP